VELGGFLGTEEGGAVAHVLLEQPILGNENVYLESNSARA